MKRRLRKTEFKRRLKDGKSKSKRFILKRYLGMTDEEIDNMIYEPLEKEECKTT